MNENLPQNFISLADAAIGTPYSQEYLSLRARQGKLFARKIGRTWYTTASAIAAYMESQKALYSSEANAVHFPVSSHAIIASPAEQSAALCHPETEPKDLVSHNAAKNILTITALTALLFFAGSFAKNFFAPSGSSPLAHTQNAFTQTMGDLQYASVISFLRSSISNLEDKLAQKMNAWIFGKQVFSSTSAPAKEIIRIETKIEKKTEIIPIPTSSITLAESLASKLSLLNTLLRQDFERSINELRNSVASITSREDSTNRIITLTQKIDRLDELDIYHGLNVQTGDLTITQGNLTLSAGKISSNDTITAPSIIANETFIMQGSGTSTFTGGINARSINLTSFLTLDGNLKIENDGLVYDAETNNLGIGTTTPGSLLSIQGIANFLFLVHRRRQRQPSFFFSYHQSKFRRRRHQSLWYRGSGRSAIHGGCRRRCIRQLHHHRWRHSYSFFNYRLHSYG
ncbi:MAG: hypothetical protein HYT37_04490 [Candidatus Sungbacteria bacterium]|nr:hypothetical protein [Candidatus Sungbacteria bacterium]